MIFYYKTFRIFRAILAMKHTGDKGGNY